MPNLWAKTATYDSIQVGDELPILVKYQSQETTPLHHRYTPPGDRPDPPSIRASEGPGAVGHSHDTVNGWSTVATVAELLEKAFPIKDLMASGSRLEMRAIKPIGPGDTITFTGQVTGKLEQGGQRLVDCQVTGTNQRNQVVARAKATIPLSH